MLLVRREGFSILKPTTNSIGCRLVSRPVPSRTRSEHGRIIRRRQHSFRAGRATAASVRSLRATKECGRRGGIGGGTCG